LKGALDVYRSLKRRYYDVLNRTEPGDEATRHPTVQEDFEQDFTTRNGTPSKLESPFAKITNRSPPNIQVDPIAAEFYGGGLVGSGAASAQHNPSKCPIRYLDQYSPEEVTKYFENYKHEIPRSHAVCISRY
jgi:hypothetical protein